MAIAKDNATIGSNTGSQASLTFSHTVAGGRRHLTVIVGWRNATVGSISGVTYNGVAMTFIAGSTRAASRVEAWGIVAPAIGTNNVVITHSAGFDNGCTALAISHIGVDQVTPRGTPSTNSGTSGNPTVTPATALGDVVIDGEIGNATTTVHTVGAGQTQELNQQGGSGNAKIGASTKPGSASSTTMSWTYNISPGWANVAFALKPDTGIPTLDNSAVDSINSTSRTTAFTIAANSNRILIVEVANSATTAAIPVSGVTWGGVPLTLLIADEGINSGVPVRRGLAVYYLLNPAPGTDNVVVTMSASAAFNVIIRSYYNVQSLGTPLSTNGNGTSASLTPASADGDLVIGTLSQRGTGAITATNAFTVLVRNQISNTNIHQIDGETIAPPTSTGVGYSWTGADAYAMAGVALKSTSSAVPATLTLGAVAGVAAVANSVVSTPARVIPGNVAGAATVANLAVATPALLSLGGVAGAAAPTAVVSTAANLVLGSVAGVASVAGVVVGTPRINLASVAGAASLTNVALSAPAPLAIGAVAGIAVVSNAVVGTPKVNLGPVAGIAAVANLAVAAPARLSLGSVAGAATVPEVTIVTTSAFVTRSGPDLIAPNSHDLLKMLGVNRYNIMQLGQDLGVIEDLLIEASGMGINAMRFWFFQEQAELYTGSGHSTPYFTRFYAVLDLLEAYGMYAIPVLGNQWGDTDGTYGTKGADWYSTDYLAPYGNYQYSFDDYVAAFCAEVKDDPRIAYIQLMNEAECSDATDFQAFADNLASIMRANDPNHLISLGTMGGGQAGMSNYVDIYASYDVADYHDYNFPSDPSPTNLELRLSQMATEGKPLTINEVGINSTDSGDAEYLAGGESARAAALSDKLDYYWSQVDSGCYLIWSYRDTNGNHGGFEFDDGDPLFDVIEAKAEALGIYEPGVTPTVVESQLASGDDDLLHKVGSGGAGSHSIPDNANDNPVGLFDSGQTALGAVMRFADVAIDQGQVLSSAKLVLVSSGSDSANTVNSKIVGIALDDPAMITSDADVHDSMSYPWTSEVVNWDAIPAWVSGSTYESPDISAIIQEIIDRPGWVSGNSIILIWQDFEQRSDQNDNTLRRAQSYDNTPANAPILHLEYIGVAEAELTLSPISGSASVATLAVATPAPLVPAAVAGVATVASLTVGTPRITLGAVAGVASLPTVAVSTPANLALGAVVSVAATTNVTVGTSRITLQAVAGIASLATLAVATSATVALSSVAGVASLSNITLTTGNQPMALSAISGVASLQNVAVSTVARLTPGAVSGVATVSAVLLKAASILALGGVSGLTTLANVTVGTPSINLGAIQGEATLSNVSLTAAAGMSLNAVNGVALASLAIGTPRLTLQPVFAVASVITLAVVTHISVRRIQLSGRKQQTVTGQGVHGTSIRLGNGEG